MKKIIVYSLSAEREAVLCKSENSKGSFNDREPLKLEYFSRSNSFIIVFSKSFESAKPHLSSYSVIKGLFFI